MSGRRLRLSASSRVLLAMTGVIALTIVVLFVVAAGTTRATIESSVDDTLMREADAYAAAIAGAPDQQGLVEATRAYLAGRDPAGSGLEPILLLALADGRTIANTDVKLEHGKLPASGFGSTQVGAEHYRVLSVPVSTSDGARGTFYVAVTALVAEEAARNVAYPLMAAGLIALALALPMSYIATRRALRPLVQMAADAERIGTTSTVGHITYDGPHDELGTLADALERMLARLDAAAEDQRAFVADASHELRTPVAVVRGNAELLLRGALSENDAHDSLSQIDHEARRMGRLLDDLLSLARLEAGVNRRFQPLSVNVMLEEAAARGRALGDRDIRVESDCDAWVLGQPDLLDQALANLVRNAVSHTPAGGRVVLACTAANGRVSISVSDDGEGVAAADIDRVFDRFYRGTSTERDDSTGGAGLGLAITKRLVEVHDGTISVERLEPHGTRFRIELPEFSGDRDGASG